MYYDAYNVNNDIKSFTSGLKNNFSYVIEIFGNFGDTGWNDGGQVWVDVNDDQKYDFCRLTSRGIIFHWGADENLFRMYGHSPILIMEA